MALPKKGSRLIAVSGINYRYMVISRMNATEIFIEQENAQGQKLHVASGLKEKLTITPSIVMRIITAAIKKGWEPNEKGKQFGGLLIEDYVGEV
jgi:hypothetical protein